MLRIGNIEDIAHLSQQEQSACDYPWRENQLRQSVQSGSVIYQYELDEKVVAYALIMAVLDEIELLNFVVFQPWQHQGIGSSFLNNLIELFAKQQYRVIHLEVRESNLNAIALYRKTGFSIVHKRLNYYAKNAGRENALIMQYLI